MGFFDFLIFMFVIAVVVTVLVTVFLWELNNAPYQQGRDAVAAIGAVQKEHRLKYALVDPIGRLVGLRPAMGQIVIKTKEAKLIELNYTSLRAVSLTPVRSSVSETTGEVSTSRGSQLISAGVGAAIAGPVGAIIGGLSAPQSQHSSTLSTSSVDDLELELFFRDDALPRFLMKAGSPASVGTTVMIPELGEAFKDMAARLANIVEAQTIRP